MLWVLLSGQRGGSVWDATEIALMCAGGHEEHPVHLRRRVCRPGAPGGPAADLLLHRLWQPCQVLPRSPCSPLSGRQQDQSKPLAARSLLNRPPCFTCNAEHHRVAGGVHYEDVERHVREWVMPGSSSISALLLAISSQMQGMIGLVATLPFKSVCARAEQR